ncbi:divergent polysaccharide deacetylase family protein [Brevibacillus laterosporus]|uniref:divergent polysaccharide deacetylase family protein n=1 Tax=Brevibacillus laterosporus TaxID=1465 RepID=UPI003D1D76DC
MKRDAVAHTTKKGVKVGLCMWIASKLGIVLMLCGALVCSSVTASEQKIPEPIKTHKVALIIDDFGNNMKGTEEILNLPIPLTIAVMPFLPSTKKDAEMAHQKKHDVIVHMPMEPMKGPKNWLGPGALMSNLSDEEIRQRVNKAIDDVPHAIGMNNHMGSKITQNPRIMRIVLQVCKERGLFYIDSKTSYKSIVGQVARELQVPYIENMIFLDDVHTTSHIAKQLKFISEKVKQNEACIAIGHVGPGGKKVAKAILSYLPQLQKEATIMHVSQMVNEKQATPTKTEKGTKK